ncbi:hypothetical protein IZ6_18530 [Terrihabitans soli]|uniref:Uncharacterized protein n=1 Tax=Terrihabitans soli TaxID=708113 RepID=A0A6S6QX42_9HYPH|nr:hypothetical protein [Terrihabitans soli]BCJ91118.1 hypothetical protein IZ6_18530 [Terrihabitans soli]
MLKSMSRPAAAALAVAIGLTSVAHAAPLSIWSASRDASVSTPSVQDVQYRRYRHHRHHDGISPGAAAAIGIGAVAVGAAIASQNRYYDDGYYDEGPTYYEGRSSYCDNSNKPKHYPAPAGC